MKNDSGQVFEFKFITWLVQSNKTVFWPLKQEKLHDCPRVILIYFTLLKSVST